MDSFNDLYHEWEAGGHVDDASQSIGLGLSLFATVPSYSAAPHDVSNAL